MIKNLRLFVCFCEIIINFAVFIISKGGLEPHT